MEFTYQNERIFHSSQKDLYQLVKDSENWPLFIEACKEVKILEKNGNECIRYMKSVVNHKTCEMKTRCVFYDDECKMIFKQVESPWPIKSNRGEWYVEDLKNGTSKMVLIHRVEARYGMIGNLLMKALVGKHFVYSHAEKILDRFESYLQERG